MRLERTGALHPSPNPLPQGEGESPFGSVLMTADTFDDLRDLYQEVILDHGRHPRHAHRLESFDASAKGDNPMCGDRIEVWVKLAPDGSIADTGFDARGCAISVASADLMAETVQGRSPADTGRCSRRSARWRAPAPARPATPRWPSHWSACNHWRACTNIHRA